MGEDTIFEFEAERSRNDIAASLRALAAELDGDGPVTFREGEYTAAVTPPERAAFEVEVEREIDTEDRELEIALEIAWDDNEKASAERLEDADPGVGVQFSADSGERPEPSQGRFEVYRDEADEWRWRLVHRNGNIIADGGEGYASKRNAVKGIRSVQHNAPGARIEELYRE